MNNPTHNQKSLKFRKPSGFALIATILIVSLLGVISLGLLSITTAETKSSSLNNDKIKAEANARLALMIALADLQEHAGPDQRVTATASIYDNDPSTTEIDGVNHPSWTGVWSTTDNDGRPFLYRDLTDKATGINDSRALGSSSGNDKADGRLKWLVSQPEAGSTPIDPRTGYPEPTDKGLATLVSQRGDYPAVVAPKVNINRDGAYAYWVGDEGVKARVAIDHDLYSKKPDDKNPDEGYAWLTGVPSLNHEAVSGDWSAISGKSSSVFSYDTTHLIAEEFGRNNFHDYSTSSKGLLVDTLRGGLRKNLSEFLINGDQPDLHNHSAGLSDQSRLIGPLDETDFEYQKTIFNISDSTKFTDTKHQKMAPRFGLLRTWVEKGNLAGSSNQLDLALPEHSPIADDGYTNRHSYDLQKQIKSATKPYLTEASVFYNITHYKAPSGGESKLRLHVYPRVVMWNPYNVAIKMPKTVVLLRVTGDRSVGIDGKKVTMKLPSIPDAYGDGKSHGSLQFTLEETTMEPGECLVYSKILDDSTEYDNINLEKNILSARVVPDNKNFYIDTAFTEKYTTIPADFKFRFEDGGDTEDLSIDLKVHPTNSPQTFTTLSIMKDWVCIQKANYHFKYGDADNTENGIVWNDFRRIESFTLGRTASPYYKTRDGARLRWLEETKSNLDHAGGVGTVNSPLHATSPIVNHNLHASIFIRNPNDDFKLNSTPKVFGSFNRDVWSDEASWDKTAPQPIPGGKMGGNPFASPGSWYRNKYILFDIPRPEIGVTSLAQFQHAPISALAWQPSSPIGNSWANPLSPRTSTAPEWTSNGGWNSSNLATRGIADQGRDLLQLDVFKHVKNQARGKEPDQLMHDLSYEINYALWDRFFLAGDDEVEIKKFVEFDVDSIKNARLRPHNSSLDINVDYHHAARHLEIIGAFNVNSTSEEAWRALLLSTYDRAADQDADARGHAVYPRLLIPSTGPANGADPTTGAFAKDIWNGYRSLTTGNLESDPQEVERLAKKIVEQVKIRGPFISLSDFINRRLEDDSTGRLGTLQAAIDNANLNDTNTDLKIEKDNPDNGAGVTLRTDLQAKPMHKSAGATAYLQSADLLQPLAPVLSARSDTFVIRAYGEVKDSGGNVTATAWCEAIVQRTTLPYNPDKENLDSDKTDPDAIDLGRKFIIKNFRWLNQNEL